MFDFCTCEWYFHGKNNQFRINYPMGSGFCAFLMQGGKNSSFRKGKCERDKRLAFYCLFISFFCWGIPLISLSRVL